MKNYFHKEYAIFKNKNTATYIVLFGKIRFVNTVMAINLCVSSIVQIAVRGPVSQEVWLTTISNEVWAVEAKEVQRAYEVHFMAESCLKEKMHEWKKNSWYLTEKCM